MVKVLYLCVNLPIIAAYPKAVNTAQNSNKMPLTEPSKCNSLPKTTISTPINDTKIPAIFNFEILLCKNRYATIGVKIGMVAIITDATVEETRLTP